MISYEELCYALDRHNRRLRGEEVPEEAYAVEAEEYSGSLEVGKRADLVVLSDDLFTLPIDQIACDEDEEDRLEDDEQVKGDGVCTFDLASDARVRCQDENPAGVWRNASKPEVWKRIESARGKPW